MKSISIIVAIAKNNAIGKDNKLLCHLSEDLKRFKKLTSGHTVVMGKTTYFSLPNRPLPNRRNIVITDIPGEQIEGCIMAYSIDDAMSKMEPGMENFIIGGASIYRQFIPFADKLYITWIHHGFEADTFFPEIDSAIWESISKEDFKNTDDRNPYPITYMVYRKKEKPPGMD
ncbi:MAG: dihydrofolate reductase [Bacteroidetes bacterium]|nr:dihydrofolate reductase [Bacteroidota bacterium]